MVGWHLNENIEEDLVIKVFRRQPAAGLVVQSNRDNQYALKELRKLLIKYHCFLRMSRADDLYDNAFAEACR